MQPTGSTQPPAPAGLRLIIGYKIAKASAEFVTGLVFIYLGSAGLATEFAHVAQFIRRHFTEAWSIALAEWLTDAKTAHHVKVVALAVIADALVTLLEGWALYRRFGWSRWLVIATTASLLPFEGIAIAHHPNAAHIAVLLVNLAIVVYLLRRHGMEGAMAPGA